MENAEDTKIIDGNEIIAFKQANAPLMRKPVSFDIDMSQNSEGGKDKEEKFLRNMQRRNKGIQRLKESRGGNSRKEEFYTLFNEVYRKQKELCELESIDIDAHNKRTIEMRKLIEDYGDILSSFDLRISYERIDEVRKEILKAKQRNNASNTFSFGSTIVTKPKKKESKIDNATRNKAPTASLPPRNDLDNARVISGRTSEKIMIGQEAGETEIDLLETKDLVECVIYSPITVLSSKHERMKSCIVWIDDVRSSVYISECKDCIFCVKAQQIRIHGTRSSEFFLNIKSSPIVENCSNVIFAPLEMSEEGGNRWNQVSDFNWIRPGQSPNWSLLTEGVGTRITELRSRIGI